ncbi:hypothetical protein PSACC_00425 [Paramicrosporidium saccamoebae]|uniref:Uncharacterized protein n=1 Tax=Paramicrosporidium saccamoebae TaxID=1246581 RepID=A0A2H9TPS1_9FUNG|nr:hypothetical protein PSACC_00425 [Paramicrosporidium saccamoebae]
MPRRYILYLEPNGSNPLLQLIKDFFELSKGIGLNEAQQYRPHCSITGFFEATTNPQGEFDPIEAFCRLIDHELSRSHLHVGLGGIELDPKGKANSPRQIPSVRLTLATEGVREIAALLKDKMSNYDVHIRPKLVDHISLAYIANFPQREHSEGIYQFCSSMTNSKADSVHYDPQAYLEAARLHFKDGLVESNEWNLVLHEEEHSTSMNEPHKFHSVRTWNLKSLLSKAYPDR